MLFRSAIFQFLWVWNDLLVALTFAGGTPDVAPITAYLANIKGTYGAQLHLITAGAFIAIIVPLIVFFSLQRFFVRGLLAGSVFLGGCVYRMTVQQGNFLDARQVVQSRKG